MCWGPTPKHTSLHLLHSSPHIPTHFPTHPIHSPTPLPTHLFLPPLHPNTLPYTSPHPPIPPPTAPFTSPYTPTHFPTHPMHSPIPPSISFPTVSIMWRRYHVMMLYYLNKFYRNSPIKFFTTTWNLKFCFGVGNVNF